MENKTTIKRMKGLLQIIFGVLAIMFGVVYFVGSSIGCAFGGCNFLVFITRPLALIIIGSLFIYFGTKIRRETLDASSKVPVLGVHSTAPTSMVVYKALCFVAIIAGTFGLISLFDFLYVDKSIIWLRVVQYGVSVVYWFFVAFWSYRVGFIESNENLLTVNQKLTRIIFWVTPFMFLFKTSIYFLSGYSVNNIIQLESWSFILYIIVLVVSYKKSIQNNA